MCIRDSSWVDAASGGALESMQPNTTFTYQHAIEEVDKPLMNHEAGQYQVLPLFDEEIPKYESGVFEARNLQYYRDLMESKGLLHMNEIFSKVSARVSAIGYRADMETALRTPDMAGYQLLSIQDFPGQGTAHVGILDNFMDCLLYTSRCVKETGAVLCEHGKMFQICKDVLILDALGFFNRQTGQERCV